MAEYEGNLCMEDTHEEYVSVQKRYSATIQPDFVNLYMGEWNW